MSQPPEFPGNPADPQGGGQGQGYPPPPPPPGYGAPPPPPPGYGTPPPPPPGYGAPPPGGQQPGGYAPPGYNPPPPPPPGYGPPAGGAPPAGYPPQPGYGVQQPVFSVGDAFSWAWAKFTQNALALVAPLVIYGLVAAAVFGIPFAIALGTSESTTRTVTDYDVSYQVSSSQFSALGWIVMIIGYIGVFAVLIYLQAGLATGALDIADGKPVSVGTFFKPRNVGAVVLISVLLAIAASILSCTIVGPLIISFFAQFAVLFAVDRSLPPIDAIKASFATVRGRIGDSALSWLVQYAAVLVGYIACGIGLVVGVPVAALIQTYTYRKLSGGQLVDANPPAPPGGYPPAGYPPAQYS